MYLYHRNKLYYCACYNGDKLDPRGSIYFANIHYSLIKFVFGQPKPSDYILTPAVDSNSARPICKKIYPWEIF